MILYIIYKYYKTKLETIILAKTPISLKKIPLKEMFNNIVKKKTVLIFEPNNYHFECLPGYTKYFIDLGYNVDILSLNNSLDSFCLFEEKYKIRFFVYDDLIKKIFIFLS